MPPEDLVRLTRRRLGARPALSLCDGASGPPALPLGRAHELCGPARLTLAAMIAGRAEAAGAGGPVLWIRPAHAEGRLNPDGLAAFFDPGRLVLARPERAADVLWLAEEALRSAAAPVVIAELAAPPALTPVRRLHLAAEAGAEAMRAAGGGAPLGLLLCAGEGGAQGVETRWSLAPAPGDGGAGGGARLRPRWRLDLLRARLAPPQSWRVRWRGQALAAEGDLRGGPAPGGAMTGIGAPMGAGGSVSAGRA